MRTIWNGSISFGLVNIPIGLAVATQRSDIAFRTLHRECGTPIKQKRYCPFHERDVEADELVKGWEVSKGEFVMVEEDDLEAIALQRSSSIEILRFVRLADVDSLALETLFFAEDIRSRSEIEEAVGETKVKKPELELAQQVIESISGEFDPEAFVNDYREDLRRMLEAKLEGKEIARPEPVPEAPVIDLMDALKQSVAETKKQKGAPAKKAASSGRSRRKAPARKSS